MGILAFAAVLVASAVVVALAPYIAAAGVIVVLILWFERGEQPPPAPAKDITVIHPE